MKHLSRQNNRINSFRSVQSRWNRGVYPLHVSPQVTSNKSQGISEGCFRFLIPSRSTNWQRSGGRQVMSQQCNQREKAQQRWRSPGNRQVRPLSLRFHAQVGASFLKSDLYAPTIDIPLQDLSRRKRQIRGPKSRGLCLARGVTNQHPPQMNRYASCGSPQRCLRTQFKCFLFPAIPGHSELRPDRIGVGQYLVEGRQTFALLSIRASWQREEPRVQPQTGEVDDAQLLATQAQLAGRQSAISDQYQPAFWQPSPYDRYHLHQPVNARFVTLTVRLVRFLTWGQDRQEGQAPRSLTPRWFHQQHHANPAQRGGEVMIPFARPSVVAKNALGAYLRTPTPLHRFIPAQDNWLIGRDESRNQQRQQHLTHLQSRPASAIEDAMIVLILLLVLQPRDMQHRRHRPFAWSQYGTNDQNLNPIPYAAAEYLHKWSENDHNFLRQGRHKISPSKVKSAYLAVFSCQSFG
jgi:Rod binding domain-containing protein